MFVLTCFLTLEFGYFWQTLRGPFSAVSTPSFASKYSFESSRRDLQDVHTFPPLESNLKTMKSASGKRHPGEKHRPGEETGRPQQCSEAWGKQEKRRCTRHSALTGRAPHSKMQLKFVKHVRINVCFQNFNYVLPLVTVVWCPKFTNFDEQFPEFQQC